MPVCFSLSYGLVKSTIYIRSYEKWGVCSAIKQKKTKHLGKSLKLLWRNNIWCFSSSNYCSKKQQLSLENVHLWVNSLICLSVWVSRTSIIEIKLVLNSKHPGRLSLQIKPGGYSRNTGEGDSLPLCGKLSLRHRAGRGLWSFSIGIWGHWVSGPSPLLLQDLPGWVGQPHRKGLAFYTAIPK